MKHFLELLRHLTRPRVLALAAVLVAIFCCLPASAQTYSETTYYPPGYQQVGVWTGPFGFFGGPIVSRVPPRAVTRTYSAPVIIEQPIIREYVIEREPAPVIERQRIVTTPRRTVIKTEFGRCRNPYCTCNPCQCGLNCQCGK